MNEEALEVKKIELEEINQKTNNKSNFSQIRTSCFSKNEDLLFFGGSGSGGLFFYDLNQMELLGICGLYPAKKVNNSLFEGIVCHLY